VIFACAALYPYPEAKTAEMAALTVSTHVQGQGDGEKVLETRIEQRAKAAGLDSIFVLTTRTMHWFFKRGFVQVDPDWLPEARKRKYNWDRKSQVLVKKLAAGRHRRRSKTLVYVTRHVVLPTLGRRIALNRLLEMRWTRSTPLKIPSRHPLPRSWCMGGLCISKGI
jgi:GNAT superfamily N-acetyltransferase